MLQSSLLGQKAKYVENYEPSLLFPVSRSLGRDKIGLKEIPFQGIDIWTGYEISWLNPKGKPVIAMGEFCFPYSSPNIIESKSFKYYLNSFNQSQFNTIEHVQNVMKEDLSNAVGSEISVSLFLLSQLPREKLADFCGICLDDLDCSIDSYEVSPDFLHAHSETVEETLHSNLFKSNCLATGQPDWGSIYIHYRGPRINHEGLLKYLISYRRHSGFAEHCVEQIYMDILSKCDPELLTVYLRFTRRGGLDINPFRSNFESAPSNSRLLRQ